MASTLSTLIQADVTQGSNSTYYLKSKYDLLTTPITVYLTDLTHQRVISVPTTEIDYTSVAAVPHGFRNLGPYTIILRSYAYAPGATPLEFDLPAGSSAYFVDEIDALIAPDGESMLVVNQ